MPIFEPSYDTLSNAILDIINDVEGIGKTFNFKPFTYKVNDRFQLVVNDAFHFWYTFRETAPATLEGGAGQIIQERYILEGWHSLSKNETDLQTASELKFNKVIDGIRGAFTGLSNIANGQAIVNQPMQLDLFINDDNIAGVVCHHVLMSMILTITNSPNCS